MRCHIETKSILHKYLERNSPKNLHSVPLRSAPASSQQDTWRAILKTREINIALNIEYIRS